MTPADKMKSALRYAKLGMHILPAFGVKDGVCRCEKGGKCGSPGKHPRTRHGVKDASGDSEVIKEWWSSYKLSNIGIATGKNSNVIVLDVDPRNGGNETLKKMVEKLGPLPKTWMARTGGGGTHYYLDAPGFKVSKDSHGKVFGPGLDLQGEGAYVIAPPSSHASGERYFWIKGKGPKSRKRRPLPERWLAHILSAQHAKEMPSRPGPVTGSEADDIPNLPGKILEGARNETLTSIAGDMRRRGADEAAIANALSAVNLERCSPPLGDDEVKNIARSVAKYSPAQEDVAERLAKLVLQRCYADGQHIHFRPDSQFWTYRDTHWEAAREPVIERQILDALKTLPQRGGHASTALVSQAIRILKARCAREDDPFSVADDPPQVFNCLNGEVYVLPDGQTQLRKHSPESYLTQAPVVRYEPEATCPEFKKALREIFSKSEDPWAMCRFWMELFGYVIFPARSIPLILILHGEGNDGKTTLLNLLAHMVGRSRVDARKAEDLFNSRFATSNLLDKMLFFDDDVGSYVKLADGILKKISEAKLLTAERKYGGSFEFICRVVPILACNNVMSVSDLSNGLIRRLMVLPFNRKFSKEEIDRELFPRIIRTELSGILNWAIRSQHRVQQRGMNFEVPKDVERATGLWLRQANPLPEFVATCCEVGEGMRVELKELYAAYREWADDNGYSLKPTKPAFTRNLANLGFKQGARSAQGARIEGLKLRQA